MLGTILVSATAMLLAFFGCVLLAPRQESSVRLPRRRSIRLRPRAASASLPAHACPERA